MSWWLYLDCSPTLVPMVAKWGETRREVLQKCCHKCGNNLKRGKWNIGKKKKVEETSSHVILNSVKLFLVPKPGKIWMKILFLYLKLFKSCSSIHLSLPQNSDKSLMSLFHFFVVHFHLALGRMREMQKWQENYHVGKMVIHYLPLSCISSYLQYSRTMAIGRDLAKSFHAAAGSEHGQLHSVTW